MGQVPLGPLGASERHATSCGPPTRSVSLARRFSGEVGPRAIMGRSEHPRCFRSKFRSKTASQSSLRLGVICTLDTTPRGIEDNTTLTPLGGRKREQRHVWMTTGVSKRRFFGCSETDDFRVCHPLFGKGCVMFDPFAWCDRSACSPNAKQTKNHKRRVHIG